MDQTKSFGGKLPAVTNITFDTNQTIPMSEYKSLTAKQQISFGESDLLKSKSLSTTIPIIPDGLKSFDEEAETGKASTIDSIHSIINNKNNVKLKEGQGLIL